MINLYIVRYVQGYPHTRRLYKDNLKLSKYDYFQVKYLLTKSLEGVFDDLRDKSETRLQTL